MFIYKYIYIYIYIYIGAKGPYERPSRTERKPLGEVSVCISVLKSAEKGGLEGKICMSLILGKRVFSGQKIRENQKKGGLIYPTLLPYLIS